MYRVVIESPEGVPGSPGRLYGLMGQRGNTLAHKGLVHSSPWPPALGEGKGESWPLLPFPPHERKERGGGATSPAFLPRTYRERGAAKGRSPRRIRPPLGRLLAASPLPPTYIYVGGGATQGPRQ